MGKEKHPTTIEAAVALLEAKMSSELRDALLAQSEYKLFGYSTGLWIRNNFGLHGQNTALVQELKEALGKPFGGHPDDFSEALLELLWERLHGHPGPGVLARGVATRELYARMDSAWTAAEGGDTAGGQALLEAGLDEARAAYAHLDPTAPGLEKWEREVIRGWEHLLEKYIEKWVSIPKCPDAPE